MIGKNTSQFGTQHVTAHVRSPRAPLSLCHDHLWCDRWQCSTSLGSRVKGERMTPWEKTYSYCSSTRNESFCYFKLRSVRLFIIAPQSSLPWHSILFNLDNQHTRQTILFFKCKWCESGDLERLNNLYTKSDYQYLICLTPKPVSFPPYYTDSKNMLKYNS